MGAGASCVSAKTLAEPAPPRKPKGPTPRAAVVADESQASAPDAPAIESAVTSPHAKQRALDLRQSLDGGVTPVSGELAQDDAHGASSQASYESGVIDISPQPSANLDAEHDAEKRVSLEVSRYDVSKGKGSPVSSLRFKEDVLLPAVPVASRKSEEGGSFCSAGSDMVPAPPPVWLTMEKGPVPSPCRANMGVVDDIIRGHMDHGQDPELDHVLQLACAVFKAEAAAVTLMGKDRYYVSGGIGGCVKQIGQDVPWLSAMCGYTLAPQHHEVLVIEDMLEDARFNMGGLLRWPFERFYCGCPLITTNGFRVGTLCLGGDNPRKMTSHEVNVLCNMTEVVIRRIEQAWATNVARQDAQQRLSRALSAYDTPLLFVDAGSEGKDAPQQWKIMYLNDRACASLGVTTADVASLSFEDVFCSASNAQVPWKMYSSKATAAQSFTMRRMRLHTPGSSAQAWSIAFSCLLSAERFGRERRPAAVDAVDQDHVRVGIPSYVDDGDAAFKARYFFAELAKDVRNSVDLQRAASDVSPADSIKAGSGGSGGSGSDRMAMRRAGSRPLQGALMPTVPPALEGLELGPIVGKGSYGSVYRGCYQQQHVAVKVMCNKDVKFAPDGRPLEAALAETLDHPGIVRTVATAVTGNGPTDPSGETWLVMELCNGGDLQAAVDRGLLRSGKRTQYDRADMAKVLDVASQVAAGLQHLHARSIVHGDVTGGNVLLQRSRQHAAGFSVKLADFGMARDFSVEDRIKTRMYGTVTHMPPELIESGIASKAVDVYALGVLLWEMHHGCRAWSGMTQTQIVHAVAICKQRLTFRRELSDAPADIAYFHLADACLSADPDVRPPIDAVVSRLAAITAMFARQQQPPQPSPGGPPISPHAAAAAAARALAAAPQAFSPYDTLFSGR